MIVTLLLGSIRDGRKSAQIAYYLLEKLQQLGIRAQIIDLMETPLPLMEERMGHHPNLPAVVQNISQRLDQADALIFISPEYHGSFSGVLKNAIDYFWEEFKKKPIGVVTVSAGKFGGIQASSQLQQLILSLGAFPLPTKLLVSEVGNVFDPKEHSFQRSFVTATDRFLDEYLWFAEAIAMKRNEF
ncbi:MAG: NAD(P)H-dependent oxidoreductase [Ginsengibacter sp.]